MSTLEDTDTTSQTTTNHHNHHNDHKRRAVMLLLRDEEWAKKSDRWVAEKCGVSHPFVAKLRGELESDTSSRPRTGQDGKVRNAGEVRGAPRDGRGGPRTTGEDHDDVRRVADRTRGSAKSRERGPRRESECSTRGKRATDQCAIK